MSTPRDDDALSWGGDDDPTLDVGEKRAPEPGADALEPEPLQPAPAPRSAPAPESAPAPQSAHPRAVSDERHPEPSAEASDDRDATTSGSLGNVGLVGIGMVAATFLLFAIGWLVAGFRLRDAGLPIPDVTVVALTIGAGLAPLVWFVTVLALTRGRRTWQRFLMLILGIVLLVPWPFLSLGVLA